MPRMPAPPVMVVFGARNSGRAILAERLARGWRGLAVARSEETLGRLREAHPEALTLRGDASDPGSVAEALARAEADLGGLDLVVNAVTSAPRDQPFGGGPIAEAPAGRLDEWLGGFLDHAWQVMRLGGAALARRGGGTLIQLAGGSARRGMPGRGSWAAAQFGARALTQSLAQEMRPQGVHVALLVLDGTIATDRNPMRERPPQESISLDEVARAAGFLADQGPRGWTHELVVTPSLEPWVP